MHVHVYVVHSSITRVWFPGNCGDECDRYYCNSSCSHCADPTCMYVIYLLTDEILQYCESICTATVHQCVFSRMQDRIEQYAIITTAKESKAQGDCHYQYRYRYCTNVRTNQLLNPVWHMVCHSMLPVAMQIEM